jgi:hypothetical protein
MSIGKHNIKLQWPFYVLRQQANIISSMGQEKAAQT